MASGVPRAAAVATAAATSSAERGSRTRDTGVRFSAEWVSLTHHGPAPLRTGLKRACMGGEAPAPGDRRQYPQERYRMSIPVVQRVAGTFTAQCSPPWEKQIE